MITIALCANDTQRNQVCFYSRKCCILLERHNTDWQKLPFFLANLICLGIQRATGWDWAISRDKCYQLSNRFAWAWKLASLGKPVVLLYLGFLNANEMSDRGKAFSDHDAWKKVVLAHSSGIVPEKAWNNRIDIDGTPMFTGIRSETVVL